MWRSCGTYVWSKFREIPQFCTFVEPFHEKLGYATTEDFEAERNQRIEFRLRHPPIDRHYFAEYPFHPNGGVPFFRKRFSFENYFMLASQQDEELHAYLSNLAVYAREQNRRPLFKFCRFGLRTAWMVQNFSPIVIYIARDPEAMFRSYWSFGGPQSYFIFALAMIVSKNRDCALFTEAAVRFGIPFIEKLSVAEELSEIYELTGDFDPQTWRDLFLLFWVLHLQHNSACCDLLLDMDMLATNEAYRERMEQHIAHLTGAHLSFAEVQQPRTTGAPGDLLSATGIELARNALRRLPEKMKAETVASLSPNSLRILQSLL
jgi:hypothetical protein